VALSGPEKFPRKATCVSVFFSQKSLTPAGAKVLKNSNTWKLNCHPSTPGKLPVNPRLRTPGLEGLNSSLALATGQACAWHDRGFCRPQRDLLAYRITVQCCELVECFLNKLIETKLIETNCSANLAIFHIYPIQICFESKYLKSDFWIRILMGYSVIAHLLMVRASSPGQNPTPLSCNTTWSLVGQTFWPECQIHHFLVIRGPDTVRFTWQAAANPVTLLSTVETMVLERMCKIFGELYQMSQMPPVGHSLATLDLKAVASFTFYQRNISRFMSVGQYIRLFDRLVLGSSVGHNTDPLIHCYPKCRVFAYSDPMKH